MGESGTVWGNAFSFDVRRVTKPIYVSVGHRVSLETATALCKACSLYRVPEPVRQADQLSRVFVRENIFDKTKPTATTATTTTNTTNTAL